MALADTMIAFIESQDQRLMRNVNRWQAPRWFRLWMICATRGGDGWVWYAWGAAELLSGGRERFVAVGAAALAAGAGIGVFLVLKKRIRRHRPCALALHCWANLLPPDQFSFPSGHTITAFAVAVPLALFSPHWAASVIFCAASIAVSRIALGMHFLSDVLAGCLIGASLGYASFLLFA